MKILVLNDSEMSAVISMREAIEADKEAMAIYSEGICDIPLRANLNIASHNGVSLYMPGWTEKAEALGTKIISIYPMNISKGLPSVPATMVLLDPVTGQVCSIMDGSYLTKLRTGALSGAATDLLAKKDTSVFLLIGTGGQAVTQLHAVLEVRPIERVLVYDMDADRAESFAGEMTEKFRNLYPAKIETAKNIDEAVAIADIITTVTTSKKPVFNGALIKPGTHINAVGSFTPDMQELPCEALKKADLIYVDTFDGVINESGDFIVPMKDGTLTREMIAGELGELVMGKTSGRTGADQISIFETTGSAILDIVVAKRIYDNAIKKNIGTYISLQVSET